MAIARPKQVLLVDDDVAILEKIEQYFSNKSMEVVTVSSSSQAYAVLQANKLDAVILDRNIDQSDDGLMLLEHIRSTPHLSKLGVVMLTNKKSEADIDLAYRLQADEYITKPVNLADLDRRLQAVLRRTALIEENIVQLVENVYFNISNAELLINQRHLNLSKIDYQLLLTLCEHRGKIITYHNMIDYVWGASTIVTPDTVDLAVARLRKTLGMHSYLIKSITGIGIQLLDKEDASKVGLAHANTQAELDNKTALAGSIAHEMRSPLTKINLIAADIEHKLNKQKLTTKDIQEVATLIQSTVHNANNVIDVILTNIKTNEIDVSTFQPFAIADSIQEAIQMYPFQGKEKNRVKVDVTNNFVVIGSNTLLHYVIFNLLKNSLYYFDVCPQATISISVKNTDANNYIIFKDTAVGIAEDKINNIFDSFNTNGKPEGTGLGLPFCQRVINSFGGTIKCQSELGKYTEFIISLPIVNKSLATNITQDNRQDISPSLINTLQDLTLLIIEDQEIIRKFLNNMLQDTGMNIHIAASATLGLDIANKIVPDIVLTDLNLPDMPAVDLIDALYQVKQSSNCKIIALSGTLGHHDYLQKLDDYLVKPVSRYQLIKTLHSCIEINN